MLERVCKGTQINTDMKRINTDTQWCHPGIFYIIGLS